MLICSGKVVLQEESSESSRVLTLERFQQIQSSAKTSMTAFKVHVSMTAERRFEEMVAFTVWVKLPEAASELWNPGDAVHDFISTCTMLSHQ